MKNKILITVLSIFLILVLAGCGVVPPLNQSPIASFIANPTSGVAPLEVTFNASNSSDSDGTIVSYEWDFKDGNTGTGQTVSHTFTPAGSYNVELTVTDNEGATDSVTKTIIINAVELDHIVVLPKTMTLFAGKSETIESVTATYEIREYEIPIALGDCTYASSATEFATVSDAGVVTAVAEGEATITVSYGGKTDTLEVTVIEITYRALCVGVGDYMYFPDIYGNTDLPGPPYDVNRIGYTLDQCQFGTSDTEFLKILYITDLSATKSAILQGIASTFSGADNNDVSYFYYSGHGSRLENISYLCPTEVSYYAPISTYISVDELEAALSAIPGTKVVFLDTCHSGGFIGKGKIEITISQEEIESFNEDVINIFSQAEYKGLLTTNQYKVLTACHYYQVSIELVPPGDLDPFGVFTMGLCKGCGYYGSYPADTNLDAKVSLQEAYLYVKSYVQDLNNTYPYLNITQDVQAYPNNSDYPIIEY